MISRREVLAAISRANLEKEEAEIAKLEATAAAMNVRGGGGLDEGGNDGGEESVGGESDSDDQSDDPSVTSGAGGSADEVAPKIH